MAQFDNLKNAIREAIKSNGNEEITGETLQQVLIAIVDALGENRTIFERSIRFQNGITIQEQEDFPGEDGVTISFQRRRMPDGSKRSVLSLYGDESAIIANVETPQYLRDAVNKQYVDERIEALEARLQALE